MSILKAKAISFNPLQPERFPADEVLFFYTTTMDIFTGILDDEKDCVKNMLLWGPVRLGL